MELSEIPKSVNIHKLTKVFKKNLIVFIDTGNFNASVWEV